MPKTWTLSRCRTRSWQGFVWLITFRYHEVLQTSTRNVSEAEQLLKTVTKDWNSTRWEQNTSLDLKTCFQWRTRTWDNPPLSETATDELYMHAGPDIIVSAVTHTHRCTRGGGGGRGKTGKRRKRETGWSKNGWYAVQREFNCLSRIKNFPMYPSLN